MTSNGATTTQVRPACELPIFLANSTTQKHHLSLAALTKSSSQHQHGNHHQLSKHKNKEPVRTLPYCRCIRQTCQHVSRNLSCRSQPTKPYAAAHKGYILSSKFLQDAKTRQT